MYVYFFRNETKNNLCIMFNKTNLCTWIILNKTTIETYTRFIIYTIPCWVYTLNLLAPYFVGSMLVYIKFIESMLVQVKVIGSMLSHTLNLLGLC